MCEDIKHFIQPEKTDPHRTVQNGRLCAYCGRKTMLRKTQYGWQWACLPCGAWVGCHKGTSHALGRVADAELRRWKMVAHDWFDPLWQNGGFSRSGAYHWLAKNLGLTVDECHIGMFDVATCEKVVTLAKAQLINQIYKSL